MVIEPLEGDGVIVIGTTGAISLRGLLSRTGDVRTADVLTADVLTADVRMADVLQADVRMAEL